MMFAWKMKSLLKTVSQRITETRGCLSRHRFLVKGSQCQHTQGLWGRGTSHVEFRGLDRSQLLSMASFSLAGTAGRDLCVFVSTTEKEGGAPVSTFTLRALTPPCEDKVLELTLITLPVYIQFEHFQRAFACVFLCELPSTAVRKGPSSRC